MNMSKKNYLKFKGFCDYVLTNANDEQVEFLIGVLEEATRFAAEQSKLKADEVKSKLRNKEDKHLC